MNPVKIKDIRFLNIKMSIDHGSERMVVEFPNLANLKCALDSADRKDFATALAEQIAEAFADAIDWDGDA